MKAPKLHFLDSGLLATLVRVGRPEVLKDRQKLGPLLEGFVYAELSKAVALSEEPTTISHYRDKDGVEVNLILERSPGTVVGIEIKAGATALPRHFKGLKRIRSAAGDRFVCGILLHDGERIQRVSERLFAMPIKMLWEA